MKDFYPYSPEPSSHLTDSLAQVSLHGRIYPQAPPHQDGKMELSPPVWTGRKEPVPHQLFSRRYQKGVLRDCVSMLK